MQKYFALWLAGVLLSVGVSYAGEKKLMHCFAFTTIETATEAEWNAFYKATDALPSKIPGLTRVWHGKLRRPLTLASGETKVVRSYGVCMEMNDEATLKTYTAHPAHKEWAAAYEKVRVAGTTTFDILGR